MRRLLLSLLLLALVAGDALAVTARWQRHWRRHSDVPPLPYPELLHPEDLPQFASGFVMTVTKRGSGFDEAGRDAVARPRDIAERLAACWRPPAPQSREPREITLRLQFSASGTVIGAPRITYVKAGPQKEARPDLVASIRAALADCSPLRFTGSLGTAIAGYPFAIRFVAAGLDP